MNVINSQQHLKHYSFLLEFLRRVWKHVWYHTSFWLSLYVRLCALNHLVMTIVGRYCLRQIRSDRPFPVSYRFGCIVCRCFIPAAELHVRTLCTIYIYIIYMVYWRCFFNRVFLIQMHKGPIRICTTFWRCTSIGCIFFGSIEMFL